MEAFFLSVLSGIVANKLDSLGEKAYSKLKEYLGEENVKALVEDTTNGETEKLKNEIENILKYNKKLKDELEALQKEKSGTTINVTQTSESGNNFNANGNININYGNGNDPKKP